MLNLAHYQPRYLAYCAALGRMPAEQIEHDRKRWLGGLMTGYMLWIDAQWQWFSRTTGAKRTILMESDHRAFDIALAEACAIEPGQITHGVAACAPTEPKGGA